jgi:hypothetical protein
MMVFGQNSTSFSCPHPAIGIVSEIPLQVYIRPSIINFYESGKYNQMYDGQNVSGHFGYTIPGIEEELHSSIYIPGQNLTNDEPIALFGIGQNKGNLLSMENITIKFFLKVRPIFVHDMDANVEIKHLILLQSSKECKARFTALPHMCRIDDDIIDILE